VKPIIYAPLTFLSTALRSRVLLQLEIVALRRQIVVYQRSAMRSRIKRDDGFCGLGSRGVGPVGGMP
jgi:hypothetical protein